MAHRKKILVAIATVAFAAAPAGASPILFLDRTTWLTSVATLTATITFEGLASPGVPGNYSTASGLSLSGVQFIGPTSSGYFLYTQDPGTASYLNWNSGDLLMGGQASWGASIRVNLPAGVTAVGTDVMTHTPFAAPVVLSLSTGHSFVIPTLNHPNRAFAGVVSSVPISWIQLTPQSSYVLVDNFAYGDAGAVPEPDTLIMAATGLLGLWVARRTRRS
ncbi:MAG: PEP-CTERM sorting domain-containing protein [Bryobacteraceae bacterium]|nr:PEP-CTERM sorting domain-containing protein [Bryobacteraceae bacterium]